MEVKGLDDELLLYNIVQFLKESDLISNAEQRKLHALLDSRRPCEKAV